MKLRSLICVLLSWSSHLEIVRSAKILAFYPFPLYSHFKTYQPLFEEVIRRGHNLTLLSSISLSDEFRKHYTHIEMEKYILSSMNGYTVHKLVGMNKLEEILYLTRVFTNLSEKVIQSTRVQEMIHSKNDYDLIFAEIFFGTDIFFALGKKFNAPVIATSSNDLMPQHNWIFSNPHFQSSPDSKEMSIISRAMTIGIDLFSILVYEFYNLPPHQVLIEKYFDFERENVPKIKEIMMNIPVIFLNFHHSLGFLKPDLPNVVNVAGIHFTRPKPLSDHLQQFMDEAEDGVIYVSLGSRLETNLLHQLGAVLIDILKHLPQRIVMKWDRKLLPYIPKNIFIGDWFPQPDILHHPNCRLFITHGGLHGFLESVNASVPIVGIPFYGDQRRNLGLAEHFELGMKTDVDRVRSELPGKIEEVLKNTKYKNNMLKRSSLFRDRLASPLDTAIHWVDHVLKFKDTSHLKPVSVRLTWYEFYSLDVLTILFVLLAIIFYTLRFTIRRFISLVLVLSAKTGMRYDLKSSQKYTKKRSKRD